jgi:hypothetical protein
MMKAALVHRVAVSCPVCRHSDYRRLCRSNGEQGRVTTKCVCSRCSAQFVLEEDRLNRPIRK